MLVVAVALRAHEKKLRQMFPPEGGWEIGQDSKEGNENDSDNPKLPLSRAEWLSVDARERTGQNEQPDQPKTSPYLAVEFRGVKAEAV